MKKLHCDFDTRFGAPSQPNCFAGKPEFEVTVIYNEVDKDVLTVCKDCKDYIEKDAEKHGYTTRKRGLK